MSDPFNAILVTILVTFSLVLVFFLGRVAGVEDVAESCVRYEAFYRGDIRFVCRQLMIEESR